jgi:ABC-2 type transport system ATP-binding protein
MLELDRLSRRFGDTVALDELSFAVQPGSIFGFVGPNGAGKTTAMRIVLGVLAPDGGEVRWQGQPVDAAARRRFGYMPEERGLYPKMAVQRQLVYLARLHAVPEPEAVAAARELLDELGLGERADDRVEAPSLGNQQRVQLAAALVHRPELLVLDEPFSGLDPVGVDVLADVLRRRTEAGATVIFSSHQLDLVEELCSGVAIISRGRLVASGSVADLAAGDGRRRYRVIVAGAGRDWVAGVSGAHAVAGRNGEVEVELDADVDDQALLDAAREAGRVIAFGAVRPRLVDVFREVVET